MERTTPSGNMDSGNMQSRAVPASQRDIRPAWLGYGSAVVSVSVASLATVLIDRTFPGHTKYLWLLASFLFTAWYGGVGPAVLNLDLGPVALVFFVMA